MGSVYREAGGERLSLQIDLATGCYLYRLLKNGRESLGRYACYQDALAALDQWVAYLNNGGTVEAWKEHNRTLAWVAWHQDWRRRIVEHHIAVKRWLKDHPESAQKVNGDAKKALLEWMGAATTEAAMNPELVDYAATCGQDIMDALKREAEAQKRKP
jgi:hypothetical protein